MNMQTALAKVVEKESLNADEMMAVMRLIMTGQATPAQIGGFLIGLRMKGETVTEVTAAARVMRELATKIDLNPEFLVDTCGTGGDASGTFNVSTASAFVVAAAGGRVAKHGNRSVSSKSGSADVLEVAGVNLNIRPEQVAECINELGVGFLFAQKHHSAMKHAIGPRREMAVRTIFNVLGPLTNPASAPNQVLGVFSGQWLKPLAEVLKVLGSRHVMVVNADDGLDEISIAAPTQVAELVNGEITEYRIQPEDFGLQTGSLDSVRVNTADDSLALIRAVLNNEAGAARDIVALNAGAAIYVAGLSDSHYTGVGRALDVIADGSAATRLDALIEKTRGF